MPVVGRMKELATDSATLDDHWLTFILGVKFIVVELVRFEP